MADVDDFNRQIIEEFRASDGQVGGPFKGAHLLLLRTAGAKSGRERVNPLGYRWDGDRLVVFGSKAGAPTNPDWYHSLLANPRATVELGSDSFDVLARVAASEERDRLWNLQKQEVPAFAEYEQKTDRKIPAVILERTP